jgi:alpha-1,3-mannosyltransferase
MTGVSNKDDSKVVRLYKRLAGKEYDWVFLSLLLLAEFFLCGLIVRYVAYTEIDWIAYMQEVEAYVEGERDYMKIRGDTGPLVYPAGFLYLFRWLRHVTDAGTNIRLAQYIFGGLYMATQFVVLLVYQTRISEIRREGGPDALQTRQIWSWRIAMGILCLSKRMHSIFLLRLFNDGPTMLLLYLSVYLFSRHYWNIGCVIFSLAVSIKMNVLLFAPGLLLLLLQASPDLKTVVARLFLGCALPQLILGMPFLSTYPISYLRKAFELDRVFFFKWTVNWKVRGKQTTFFSILRCSFFLDYIDAADWLTCLLICLVSYHAVSS